MAWLIIALSLIAVIYIGLVALVQQDMKKLVAYSSVAHMGFVTLGFFIFNELASLGGIGADDLARLRLGAMFLCIGVLYDRVHSREIARLRRRGQHHAEVRGVRAAVRDGQLRPAGTAGFRRRVDGDPGRGEGFNFWIALAGHGADLRRRLHAVDGQARVLRRVANDTSANSPTSERREFLMMAGAGGIAVLWMGLYPKPFTDVMDASVTELLAHVASPSCREPDETT